MKTEIHICTLNEGNSIEETLQSLEGQGVPITILDSDSDDDTVEIARQYADKIKNVPMGKLNARDIGIRESNADVILNADAGDLYDDDWVDEMTQPFKDNDNTVAVMGKTKSKERKWQPLESVWTYTRRKARIQGRNSAISRDAYIDIGGFDLSVRQNRRLIIVREEEYRLLRRLRREGMVIFNPNAICYKNQRQMVLSSDFDPNYIKSIFRGDRF